jgi:hypothetical protein
MTFLGANKGDINTIENLIVVFQEQQKYEEAILFYNKGLALEPVARSGFIPISLPPPYP